MDTITWVDMPYGTLEPCTSVTSTASINNLNVEAINKGTWTVMDDPEHGWVLVFQFKYQRPGATAWHNVQGEVSLSSGQYVINGVKSFLLRFLLSSILSR